jgi:hypothetical protein
MSLRSFHPSGDRRVIRPLFTLLLAVSIIFSTGCAMSREQQLARKADVVESSLKAEQRRVLKLPPLDPQRDSRLSHLTTLRTTLSAANIARGSVAHFLPPEQRPTAYDVLDEAYDTIEWNIPLGPGERLRPMPAGFANGTLNIR